MKAMMERLAWIGVAALATARLTRFITSDFLGEWLIVGPAKRWAWRHDMPVSAGNESLRAALGADPTPTPAPHWGWRSKLVKGLDCPYCVGFWLGAIVLAVLPLRRVPVLGALVRFGLSAFALNYVVGHVSSRIDG